MATTLPRGLRNNNPLNLRKSRTPWVGKVYPSKDSAFEQFTSMEMGVRAAFLNIHTIIRRTPGCTLAKLIHTWAPASDGNNESRYVSFVSADTGVKADAPMRSLSREQLISIVAAMVFVENGQSISRHIIEQAYDLAFS